MRKLRKREKQKLKIYAVDVCFLLLTVTAVPKMKGRQIDIAPPGDVYAEAVLEAPEAEELLQGELVEMEPVNGASEATEVTEADKVIPGTGSLIRSRDWDEGDVLRQIAMAEAEGESVEGKAMVMLVVLNRCWSEGFPDSISDVVFQYGAFEPVQNGRYYRVVPDDETWEAYDMVLHGWDESRGALYFASTDFPHKWHEENLEYLFTIGKHDFYK